MWGRPRHIFHTKIHFSSFCGGHVAASSHTKWPFLSICGDTHQRNRPTKFHFSSIWYVTPAKIDLPNFTFLSFGMSRAIFPSSQFTKSCDLWGQAGGGSGLARQGGPKPHQGAGRQTARSAKIRNTGSNRPKPAPPRPSRRNAACGGDFACPRHNRPLRGLWPEHGPHQPNKTTTTTTTSSYPPRAGRQSGPCPGRWQWPSQSPDKPCT